MGHRMRIAESYQVAEPGNPLDIAEQVISGRNWDYDRPTDEMLLLEVGGQYCDHRLYAQWQAELGTLNISSAYDLRVPSPRRGAVLELLALVNERLPIGHFDIPATDPLPLYRCGLLLRGMPFASAEQVEDLLDIALSECETYYPAFQYVIWGGQDPSAAVAAVDIQAEGTA